MNIEHPPAMHSDLGWYSHLFTRQMVKFAQHRYQGIAGRSNIELQNHEGWNRCSLSFELIKIDRIPSLDISTCPQCHQTDVRQLHRFNS